MAAVKYGGGRIISFKEILSENLTESETWEMMCFSEMTPSFTGMPLKQQLISESRLQISVQFMARLDKAYCTYNQFGKRLQRPDVQSS